MRKAPIVREKQVTQWPEYDRLEDGLPNYWYPVMLGRRLRRKVPMQILGQSILFVRDDGKVFALADRCLHRGTPMRSRIDGWCLGTSVSRSVGDDSHTVTFAPQLLSRRAHTSPPPPLPSVPASTATRFPLGLPPRNRLLARWANSRPAFSIIFARSIP